MSKTINPIISLGGMKSEIHVTGINSNGSVTCTTPSGITKTATYNSTNKYWVINKLTEFGTYTVTGTQDSTTKTETVVINTTGVYTVEISFVVKKAFSECSMEELNSICNADQAQTYIDSGLWQLGDTNMNATYGNYSGIQLVHVLTDEQRGSSYYNTEGHIVVQFINTIASSSYMNGNNPAVYFSSNLHSCCNSTIYNGLNSDFKNILKSWTCYVGKESTSSGATSGTYSQSVYMAAPAMIEMGVSNDYNTDEDAACFSFDYYKNGGSVYKTGTGTKWWLRSIAHYAYSYYYCMVVDGTNVGDNNGFAYQTYAVSPIAVI